MVTKNTIERLSQRAAVDEPNALYFLAWEYFRGEFVLRDVKTAIVLLGRLEKIHPEDARFNIAKMKYVEGDSSFVDDIRADCSAGFGPSLYLMGTYSLKRVGGSDGRLKAIEYFQAAARSGHLPAKFAVWRQSKLSNWRRATTAVPALQAFVRALIINMRNDRDVRAMI